MFTDDENQFLKQMMIDHGNKTIWLGGEDIVVNGQWYWASAGSLITGYTGGSVVQFMQHITMIYCCFWGVFLGGCIHILSI